MSVCRSSRHSNKQQITAFFITITIILLLMADNIGTIKLTTTSATKSSTTKKNIILYDIPYIHQIYNTPNHFNNH